MFPNSNEFGLICDWYVSTLHWRVIIHHTTTVIIRTPINHFRGTVFWFVPIGRNWFGLISVISSATMVPALWINASLLCKAQTSRPPNNTSWYWSTPVFISYIGFVEHFDVVISYTSFNINNITIIIVEWQDITLTKTYPICVKKNTAFVSSYYQRRVV